MIEIDLESSRHVGRQLQQGMSTPHEILGDCRPSQYPAATHRDAHLSDAQSGSLPWTRRRWRISKNELITAEEVAVDEDGKMLVWIGEGIEGNRVNGSSGEQRKAVQL